MEELANGAEMKRKPKVYVETSVLSNLTARDSTVELKRAYQMITRAWWKVRSRFDLYVSSETVNEISRGDPEAARLRRAAAVGIPLLRDAQETRDLARTLLEAAAVPVEKSSDALHIASAAVHGMDFIVTWNHAHISNDKQRDKINEIIVKGGFTPPQIVRPDDLLETENGK